MIFNGGGMMLKMSEVIFDQLQIKRDEKGENLCEQSWLSKRNEKNFLFLTAPKQLHSKQV